MLNNVKITNLLKSRVVLWLLFVIALTNMYAYLMSANEEYIAFMLLSGFITSFLCKNMIVVLFFAICVPNILRFVMEWTQLQEGLATIEQEKESTEDAEDKETNKAEDKETDKADSEEKDSNEDRMNDLIHKMKNIPDVKTDSNAKPDLKISQAKLNDLQKRIANAHKQISNIPDDDISKEMTEMLESQDKIIHKLQTLGNKLS